MMFILFILADEAGHHSLIPDTPQLGHVHNGSLATLQTLLSLHCWQIVNTNQVLRAAGSYLIYTLIKSHSHVSPGRIFIRTYRSVQIYLVWIIRSESERDTATSVQQLDLIFPGETVSSELLSLTVGSCLPQANEVLRYCDGLDGGEDEVTLSVQSYRHWV